MADFQITAEYDDKTAIHDLAVQSDVLTYEFENVDAGAIDECAASPHPQHRLAARDPAPRAREAVHQRPRHRHRTVARCQQLR